MPVLLSETEVRLEWNDIESRKVIKKPKHVSRRSSGVHLSGVIKHVLTTSGMLNTEDLTDEFPLRMAIGMAWEDWAVGLWPGLKWQPGECSMDGIAGSPDGITTKPVDMPFPALLEEFKATWKSVFTRADITKEKLWMWQLAGYLKMLGMRYARLHVLWVNGTYRPPSPKYSVYLLEFTQEELDRFWVNVVLKNRDRAVPETH